MKLILSPYLSLGPVKVGMTRDEVCAALASEPEEFKCDPTGVKKADNFDGWDLRVYYNAAYVCEAIEAFNLGQNSVVYKGRDLLGTKYPSCSASSSSSIPIWKSTRPDSTATSSASPYTRRTRRSCRKA
jgi:hypothetical protein